MVGGSIYPVCFCGQFTGILRTERRLVVLCFACIRTHVNHTMFRAFDEIIINAIALVSKSHSVSEFFNVFLPDLFDYVDIGCRHIPKCGTFKVDVFWILVFFIGVLVVKKQRRGILWFPEVDAGRSYRYPIFD